MLKFIRRYAVQHWGYYLSGLFALILTNYVTTLIPLKLRDIIHLLQSPHTSTVAINSLIGDMIFLAVTLAVSRSLSRILIFIPGRLVEYQLRNDLYLKLMSLSTTFYRKEKVGDLMSRLTNDIQNLRLTVALGFLHICNTVMIYTIVFYQMFKIHLGLTLLVLLPIPIVMLTVRFFVKQLHHYISKNQSELGQLTNFFVEMLGHIRLIKNFVAEKQVMDKFKKINSAYFALNIQQAKIRSTMFPFIAIIGSLGQFILFSYGGYLIIQNKLTLGDFIAVSAYIVLLAWPTASLAWIINIVQRGKVSLTRVMEILSQTNDLEPISSVFSLDPASPPHIELKNLTFAYPHSEPVLKNISLTIRPSQMVGLFGPTGCGKSTLASILARLEPCSSGAYFIQGCDVTGIPLQTIRALISYLPQSPFLFSDTLAQNIQYADQVFKNDSEAVIQATQHAFVYDDIQKFPKGFETLIGEKGIILSGGQKSRLALARALYQDHAFFILDDILSAVDHETEHALIQMLKSELRHKTSLLISHRISALTQCDWIYVLENGEITDQGRHEDLIHREGIYKHTWMYQKLVSDL